MKNLILAFCIFFSTQLYSQNVTNDTAIAFEVIDTDTILYYSSGGKYCEVQVKNTFVIKVFYFDSGEIQSKTIKYKKTESFSTFDKNGVLREQGTNRKNKYDGYMYFYDNSGRLEQIAYYKKGKFKNNIYY